MPETRATLRYSGTSPYKVRAVLGLIRGIDVTEARQRLQFCGRDAADEVMKVLDSAIANAEENDHLPSDELYVSRAWADEGPTQKRWRPRARGRGTRIRKRTSHVTVVVARYSDEELQRRARRDAAVGRVPDRRRRVQRRRRAEREAAAAEAAAAEAEASAESALDEETGTEETGAEQTSQVEAVEAAETEAGAEDVEAGDVEAGDVEAGDVDTEDTEAGGDADATGADDEAPAAETTTEEEA
jgi:large subunit ribosomal protein L22